MKPERLGDAKFSIVSQYIKVGSAKVLRLNDNYSFRSLGDKSWQRLEFDQCLYLLPAAVAKGNLRVYLKQVGLPIVGPLQLSGSKPERLQHTVRGVIGDVDDWTIISKPLSCIALHERKGVVNDADWRSAWECLRFARVFLPA